MINAFAGDSGCSYATNSPDNTLALNLPISGAPFVALDAAGNVYWYDAGKSHACVHTLPGLPSSQGVRRRSVAGNGLDPVLVVLCDLPAVLCNAPGRLPACLPTYHADQHAISCAATSPGSPPGPAGSYAIRVVLAAGGLTKTCVGSGTSTNVLIASDTAAWNSFKLVTTG